MAEETTLHSTKVRSRKPNWSELPIDPCEIILSKLTPKSILRFKAVCPSWKRAADFILMSPTFTCAQEPPWLLLPRHGRSGFRFYSLEGKGYNLTKNITKELDHSVCLASDQGLLLLLVLQNMSFSNLLLFNPLSGTQILLPPLRTFPDILDIAHYQDEGSSKIKSQVNIKITSPNPNPTTPPRSFCLDITSLEDIRKAFVTRAVILNSSNNKTSSIGVFVLYRYIRPRKPYSISSIYAYHSLAFCTTGEDEWTKLDEQRADYHDITSYENQLYALCCDHTRVQVWDVVSSFPVKKLEIKVDASSVVAIPFSPSYWLRNPFIIKTCVDDLFLVVVLIHRDLIVPTEFLIFKLDSNDRWMAVDSINDHALVFSTNQSVSISSKDLPEYDQNPIYFTHPIQVRKQPPGYRCGLYRWRNKDKEVRIGEVTLDMNSILFVPNPFSHIQAS